MESQPIESQPQNPEFRNNPENCHQCVLNKYGHDYVLDEPFSCNMTHERCGTV